VFKQAFLGVPAGSPNDDGFFCQGLPMGDGGDGANLLAIHANDATGFVNGNGVKGGNEASLLRADSYTSAALDAGVPIDDEDKRLAFWHGAFP